MVETQLQGAGTHWALANVNPLRAVCGLMRRADVRLVTLLGPGGVDKTRLGLAAAEALHGDFPDGVIFIELAALRDPALLTVTVAQALHLRDAGSRPILERLKRALRTRRCLLLLDNFQHLVTAAPVVTRLLTACPRLKMLVTSREALHVTGEYEYQVPPLAVPEPPLTGAVEPLTRVPAVELFVQRARAVRPAFTVTPANAAAVADICVRLDGLPLAIELAAARTKILSPASLSARLSGRLALLTRGVRDAPARLQTMRDAITWSYDLLDDWEQTVFRRLSVFAGGLTLDAAEVVVSDEPAGTDDGAHSVFAALAALVDKSLIAEERPDDDLRFKMLETIREYAQEELATHGESAIVQRRHAAWCLGQIAQVEARILGPDERSWLDWYDREHDNFRAALAWALGGGPEFAETALLLAGQFWLFWFFRGHRAEGRRWLARAIAQGEPASPLARAWGLYAAGTLAATQGDFGEAIDLLRAALPLWDKAGSRSGTARTLHTMANMAHEQRDHAQAISLYPGLFTNGRELRCRHLRRDGGLGE